MRLPAIRETSSIVWHTLSPEEAVTRLDSDEVGLTSDEALERLRRVGPNRLERARPTSALRILLNQLDSLVVLLLAVACGVALIFGDPLEAGAIGAVLVLNTLIGFTVEFRARRAMDAILQYQVPTARVMRDGKLQILSSDKLVPGDIIQLEEGDAVPADARLVSASELRTNEAPLTGESTPVDKVADSTQRETSPVADRTSMVHAGTTIAVGRASALVVRTGMETEIGRVGTLISQVEAPKTPLEVHLDALGARLALISIAVGAVVTALGVSQGLSFARTLETGIALAIAAVPEGLPIVATIALAVGLKRMARRRALVRRLEAVEALGATTVVCADKTGTLTAGEMTATRIVLPDRGLEVTGSGFAVDGGFTEGGEVCTPATDPALVRLLRAAALSSRAGVDLELGTALGDPTDAALTILALKGGLDPERLHREFPMERDIPFSSERRFSASVHGSEGGGFTIVKGAPQKVIDRCTSVAEEGADPPMSIEIRKSLLRSNDLLAARGLRVIALASASGVDPEQSLTFLGFVGMMDPPADGVRETIQALQTAGIRTVMITGDQRATAEAVCRDLGVLTEIGEALDGGELGEMSDAELSTRVGQVAVYSRVSPEDKLRVVKALQSRGEVVAMLGDGVNDAAALKRADVGVAMGGRGTDVAKETAAIVLRDDRFTTIAVAVEEGRVIFDNIRRFVFYLFSCNLAEVSVVLGASLASLPLPLLPLQILWLNLVTDTFPALALAMEPGEPDIMRRPPRPPGDGVVSRNFVKATVSYSLIITGATLSAFVVGLRLHDTPHAVTMAFMTLALSQLFHLENARSTRPARGRAAVTRNPWAAGAVVLVIVLQLMTIYLPPLSAILRTTMLTGSDWLWILALSVQPILWGRIWSFAGGARGRRRSALSGD